MMTKKKAGMFGRITAWIKDVWEWLSDMEDWKRLLRSVPSLVVTAFAVSVVVMNLMAAKTIIMTDPSWLGITGGLFISWVPFLCMDVVTKTYGARAATKLNILTLIINLICIAFFHLISHIYIGPAAEEYPYTSFDATFSQTWQIFTASSVAFLLSGIVNNCLNVLIGNRFKKDPEGRAAYMTRSYISTAVGQFVDNYVFTGLAFLVFFKMSIGSTLGWTGTTVLGTALFGALLELLMEVVFSPIGYKVCQNWRKEEVGKDYLEYCRRMEVYKDRGRVNY